MDNTSVSHPPKTLEGRVAELETALAELRSAFEALKTEASVACDELAKTQEATVVEVTRVRELVGAA